MARGIRQIFTRAYKSPKIGTFIGSFYPKYKIYYQQSILPLSLESTEELFLMALEIDRKFEEKLTCVSKHCMRNLVHFYQDHVRKSKN